MTSYISVIVQTILTQTDAKSGLYKSCNINSEYS